MSADVARAGQGPSTDPGVRDRDKDGAKGDPAGGPKGEGMRKIVLIGAGSAQFGYTTLGEIFASPSLRESEVVLLDINPEALSRVLKAGQSFIEAHSIPCRLSATTDREAALPRADFVVISIEVGDRFKLWDQDRTVPQQYGIRQVYGENGGPGGLFHSLRIIPPILEICADVRRLCPQAIVFNYSNPMSRICTAVHRAYPELNFIGLCHEIASLERYLPRLLERPLDQLQFRAAGLNHFSCLLEIRDHQGQDLYPEVLRRAPEFFARVPGSSDYIRHVLEGNRMIDTEGARQFDPDQVRAAWEWTERGLFRFVLQHFDLLPITTDSHFGEYVAWAWDVVEHRGILDFYRYYQQLLGTQQPIIELQIKERLVPLMEGILLDQGWEEPAVNLPNRGYLRELPDGLAVEVPARIDRGGATASPLNPLPRAYAGLLQNQVAVHEMTVEAVLTRSKKAVVQALLVDPVVDRARCLPELVEVMVDLQSRYLGYLT